MAALKVVDRKVRDFPRSAGLNDRGDRLSANRFPFAEKHYFRATAF